MRRSTAYQWLKLVPMRGNSCGELLSDVQQGLTAEQTVQKATVSWSPSSRSSAIAHPHKS